MIQKKTGLNSERERVTVGDVKNLLTDKYTATGYLKENPIQSEISSSKLNGCFKKKYSPIDQWLSKRKRRDINLCSIIFTKLINVAVTTCEERGIYFLRGASNILTITDFFDDILHESK